ncbi:5266_t:CDS:2 [Funneliformis geosporum]|uniref:5266_t:CDS:1 n=1 Tax=Funneliformis geosporum TaxID=1117311 RepID=A0A9W4SDU5_9GLOM|nr:5266_t:CDS:2 [Funneliformis geosporum]
MYSATSTPVRTPSKTTIYNDSSFSSLNHVSNINIKNSNNFVISRVNFSYETVRHKNKLFEEEFINYVNSVRNNLSLKKQQWQITFSADKGTRSQLYEQVKLTEKKQKDDLATKEKEKRDINKIQSEISELKRKRETIKEHVSNWRNQIENLKRDIQRRREINMSKKQALQAQLSKNEPELKRYADKLAFTMIGMKDHVFQPCSDSFFSHLPTIVENNNWLEFAYHIPLTEHQKLYIRNSYKDISKNALSKANPNRRKYSIISGTLELENLFLFYIFWQLVKKGKHPTDIPGFPVNACCHFVNYPSKEELEVIASFYLNAAEI